MFNQFHRDIAIVGIHAAIQTLFYNITAYNKAYVWFNILSDLSIDMDLRPISMSHDVSTYLPTLRDIDIILLYK